MGCASSKKKTKSLEDIQAGLKGSSANGQIAKDDSKLKRNRDQNAVGPVQIPGAHKSFLAPDGIPFIDEDVEEDVARSNGVVDVNENSTSKEQKTSVVGALVGGGEHVDRKSNLVTNNTSEYVPVSKPQQVSPVSLSDEEAAIKIQAGVRGYLDRKKIQNIRQHTTKCEEFKVEEYEKPFVVTHQPKYDENTAATKIQANFKGYKTRKQLRLND